MKDKKIIYSAAIAYDITGLAGFIFYKSSDTHAMVVNSFYHRNLSIDTFKETLLANKVERIWYYTPNERNLFKGFFPAGMTWKKVDPTIDIESNNALFKFQVDNRYIIFNKPPLWRFDIKDKNCQAGACAALVEAIKPIYWLKYAD